MSIEIIKGDLIKLAVSGKAKYIVHGCNCFHAMGSGIAGVLAKKFPEIPEADNQTTRGSVAKLSYYSIAAVTYDRRYTIRSLKPVPVDTPLDNPFICINLYTQYKPGADFMPSLFPEALKRLNKDFKGETLWFPMIGCGIGGGDWTSVMNDMLTYLTDVNVKVVVL